MRVIEKIEKRFLEIAGFECDLSEFPLNKESCPQIINNKEKSNLHGEVFTPLWFVDKMVLKASESLLEAKTTHDLCAGYGQFTMRMMRYLANNKKNFDPKTWLEEIHSFSEYQISSACKLLYIFGTDINLFIGDAIQLSDLEETDKGVLFYIEDEEIWFNITEYVKTMFKNAEKYSDTLEKTFVKKLKEIKKEKGKEIEKNKHTKNLNKLRRDYSFELPS